MKRRAVVLACCLAAAGSLPLQAQAMEADEVYALAQEAGEEYGICPEFLQAVAWQESRYDPEVSSGGCEGLLQVAGRWHGDRMERLGVADLYDPAGNMAVAADYLAELFARYEDPGMVLMVYNGDSRAEHYWKTGEGLSDYAQSVLELSENLEREHGK